MNRCNVYVAGICVEVIASYLISIPQSQIVSAGYRHQKILICNTMDEHYSFNITLQTLSTIACMSESKMKKLFKSVYNMSITEYIQRKRISVAEHMLIQTDLTIAEISRIVGYSNPSRLIEIFKRYYGFTPSKYRK